MYEQTRGDILFIILYAMVTAMALIASCYLLFRRGNAFASDVVSPVRLRRWTAAFFAATTLSHLWYLPSIFLNSDDAAKQFFLFGGLLDTITVFPLAIVILFIMLQDRRRPLWSVAVMMAPLVVGMVWSVASSSFAILPILYVYLLLMSISLIIYMVRALRQYGRWLRDNYADLEHKEVWQSFTVLGTFMLMFGIYAMSGKVAFYEYALQLADILLTSYLLWRVETLSDLTIQKDSAHEVTSPDNPTPSKPDNLITSKPQDIATLLQQHCIDTQLYLQHDLTLMQLARTIGTNRYYLSRYFSQHGTTYNAYINGLRIDYFINLYRTAAADKQSFTVKQMAEDSGYRNYATFSSAFKQRMGKNVTAWMQNSARQEP